MQRHVYDIRRIKAANIYSMQTRPIFSVTVNENVKEFTQFAFRRRKHHWAPEGGRPTN